MKVQNIFRMQAAVIGLAAALFVASPAPAQEIVNTSFNDGPNTTSFDQPTAPAAAQVTAAQPATANSASAPALAVATPVVTNEAVVTMESSAEGWMIVSAFFGIMMLALYALAEVRRARKSTRRPTMFERRAAYN
jgi:di/tricarboxylate transporter